MDLDEGSVKVVEKDLEGNDEVTLLQMVEDRVENMAREKSTTFPDLQTWKNAKSGELN